jgi:small subunit ribosomal protein S6
MPAVVAVGRRFAPPLLACSAAMATEAPLYDLTLLLDTQMETERRDQILANVEHAIEASGEIVGRHEWGVRQTAYEVRKHTDAEYHLIQFHGAPALLEQLDHNLKITDGILRHRIIKLRPGTPPPPDLSAAATATAAPVADVPEA